MPSPTPRLTLSRRRFGFWIGLGLFSLAEKLHAEPLDALAAALMPELEPADERDLSPIPEHWSAAENTTWRWYERENWTDDGWQMTGLTTPINKRTGERFAGATGYLDDSLVPFDVRRSAMPEIILDEELQSRLDDEISLRLPGEVDTDRKNRHGRPPSKWLRSLQADELSIWLQTIEVPEAGVSGMTFWEHLTRDHAFDPVKIDGLTLDEQAKLHAAAHFGY